MWKNFFVVTLRSIKKNKLFNLINITGLAIGLASAIFIILYIISESGYDRFHERSEDIYRVCLDGKMAGEVFKGAYTSPVTAVVFNDEIPEIENYCRLRFTNNILIWSDPASKFLENRIMYADSSFFEVFSFELIEGDPATCLNEPKTIVLSESKAKQYFPDGNVLGKSIAINRESELFRVTGIVEDAPRLSHFQYDFICSYCTDSNSRNSSWFSNHMQAYLLAKPGSKRAVIDEKIKEVTFKHISPAIKQLLGVEPQEFLESDDRYGYFAQPLEEIHLDTNVEVPGSIGFKALGNKTYLIIFAAIAFFVLLIAAINFMNLSTARSMSRAKEVSLRKVVGSGRKQLIRQFLFESVFLSLISLVLALVLIFYFLKPFNTLMNLNLSYEDIFKWYMLPVFILLAVLVGLLSGSYPSIVLASFKPIQALKGANSSRNGTGFLRNLLVIIQFTISIVIIAGTLVIYWQFRYMTTKDLGFDEEQLVVMDRIHPLDHQIQTFKEELTSHASILSATNATSYMGAPNNGNPYHIKGRPDEEAFMFWTNWTDEDLVETHRIELATPDSRFFSKEFPSDSSACLVNEAAIRKYNIEDPLNQMIREVGEPGEHEDMRIIGVVRDHHYASLKHEVAPQIIQLKPDDWHWAGYLTVRLAPGKQNIEAGLDFMDQVWHKFTDDEPLQYFFLDEKLDSYYAEEKRTGLLTMVFSIVAIVIACLGLFGLTLYNSQKRIREIGLRKALGASENSIIGLVSKSVINAVGISILIAMPVAYFMMRDWLRGFPYNVGFQPMLFLSAAILVVFISMITVTMTSLRAARTDPAVCLHYE